MSLNGSGLEAHRPIRRSSSHLGEETVASRKEEADGEGEVGEKIQNFGTGHEWDPETDVWDFSLGDWETRITNPYVPFSLAKRIRTLYWHCALQF